MKFGNAQNAYSSYQKHLKLVLEDFTLLMVK